MVKYKLKLLHGFFTVPNPVVTISAPNNLTTGQSVTLDCSIVAVRGITSRVDIVWYDNDDVQVRRMNNITASIINDTAAVYTDSVNISLLTQKHDGRVYSCEAIINSEPSLINYSSITINITCKFIAIYIIVLCHLNNIATYVYVSN